MSLKFNIGRPKIDDDEIERRKDFEALVRKFKEESLKKARADDSWHRKKLIRYTAIIAGVTVICTITYQSLKNSTSKQVTKHETITTQAPPKPIKRKPVINPQSQKLKTNYTAYKVNVAKGGTLAHGGQTKIKVPSKGFVNKDGRDVVGDVTIEYREFHDVADIISNGIPLAYDSAGHQFNLETAGMFDIRGHQNGEPVFVKKDKPIEVNLASKVPDDRFNQYYFDTIAGNWQYLRRDNIPKPSKPVAKAVTVRQAAEDTNSEARIRDVYNKRIDSVGKIYAAKVNSIKAPKKPVMLPKATPGRPTFVLDGSYEEFPELSAFNNVVFEVGPENKNYSRELHEITWSDVRITPGPQKDRNYLLNLSWRNRREQLVVYPVLAEKDYAAAEQIHRKKLAEYERLAEKRAQEERRLLAEMEAKQKAYLDEQRRQQEAARRVARERQQFAQSEAMASFDRMSNAQRTNRIFAVSQFGLYNSDCPHRRPQGEGIRPQLVLHGSNKPLRADFLYLVDHKNKTVYEFAGNEPVIMDAAEKPYSLCVFSNKRLFICDKASFASTREKDGRIFQVKELPEKAETPAGLREALEL